MDLSPRTAAPDESTRPAKKRNWGAILFLIAVLAGGGVVVGKFLTSAIDYYCNADEIGVKSSCSGERRVRVQGRVDQGSIVTGANGAIESFAVTFNDVTVPIDYRNGTSVPDLFQACIPVVVEGSLSGGRIEGTNIEVKHSNEYEAANPDRLVDDSILESDACSQPA
ncbi:MAG: cytochrome c maturation protein CcmE [Ilumatobacteraceae bacterium]